MDSTSPLPTMRPGYVRAAYNCDLGLVGGYSKRNGFSEQLSSAWTGKSITGGIEYSSSSVSRRQVIFGTDGTAAGGVLGYNDAGTPTSILSSLSGTTRPGLVQFRNLLFFYNGADTPKVYDGSGTRQIGITAPTNAPTLSPGTTGNLTQLGTYVYAYTYYNSATGAESSPSPLSAVTTLSGANDDFTLTISAGSATTADTTRIYRTVANGNILYLAKEVAISSTSTVDTASDASLGVQLEEDNSRIDDWSSTAKYPTVAQNRVFLRTDANEVRYSKIGQSGAMPESFEATAFVDTMGANGTNDAIVGLASANDIPIVLKQSSIGRLTPIGQPSPDLAFDNVRYIYEELSNTTGAVSHWGAVQCLNELVFLSRDNIYATDGQRVRPVGDAIQATIRGLGFTASQSLRISAANNTRKRQIYFAVFATSASATPDWVLVGDYQQVGEDGRARFRWTIDTPGTDTDANPGIKAGCMFPVTNATDGGVDILFGNTQLNGQLYKMRDPDTTSDNGDGIYFNVVSRPYALGGPLNDKLFQETGVHAGGDGNSYSLTIASIYDLSGQEELSSTFDLSTPGDLWDNDDWYDDTPANGTLEWATNLVTPRRYFPHRKAKYQQLVFRQTEADAPVDILGWGSSGSLFRIF